MKTPINLVSKISFPVLDISTITRLSFTEHELPNHVQFLIEQLANQYDRTVMVSKNFQTLSKFLTLVKKEIHLLGRTLAHPAYILDLQVTFNTVTKRTYGMFQLTNSQDSQSNKTIKTIYVYENIANFKELLKTSTGNTTCSLF